MSCGIGANERAAEREVPTKRRYAALHKHTLNPIIILNNKLNALKRKIEATVKHSQRCCVEQ